MPKQLKPTTEMEEARLLRNGIYHYGGSADTKCDSCFQHASFMFRCMNCRINVCENHHNCPECNGDLRDTRRK